MGIVETIDYASNGAGKLALTRTEAAKVLSMSTATLDRLAARKLIHPSRATRNPLYPVAEIKRFLRETTTAIEANSNSGGEESSLSNCPRKGEADASKSTNNQRTK